VSGASTELTPRAIRLEFVEGLVHAMAGGSPEHNRIVMRLTLQVGNQLAERQQPCEAYGPDQKLAEPATIRAGVPHRAQGPSSPPLCARLARDRAYGQ
jgi:hypothetical protein